ncbi:hypothetical protein [Corynebacterium mucifaciens]|uniref:Uncharacterized protein HemX n=1 Tax=Corynebacterium mucifaciens TaxID=57171 RepID=A0A7X6LRR6_9CORY|nr:hypothetical protein [Corynebacterium mucifaciens]NKY69163.1 hypothetical protein [Corynebacterium mucifaciens]
MNRTLRAATVAAAILAVPAVNATAQDLPAHEVAQTPAADPVAEDALGVGDVESTGDAPVASGLVEFPPVLTLDGTTYYLNKDGHTFVTDIERVDADATPEEVAASEALISANAGEIGRQGLEAARAAGEAEAEADAEAEAPAEAPAETQYAATTRGLEAETGSNTLVRAVFALLLASALGAAFFAFARRRLI